MLKRGLIRVSVGLSGIVAAGTGLQFFSKKPDIDPDTTNNEPKVNKRQIVLDGYTLKQVQILIRHGARTPIHTMRNMQEVGYNNEFILGDVQCTMFNHSVVDLTGGERPFSTYDAHYAKADKLMKDGGIRGVLTKCGQYQMYEIGKSIGQQYIEQAELIDSLYNPTQVYVRSTNTNRTIGTARCVLAGMYGHLDKGIPHSATNGIHVYNDKSLVCLQVSLTLPTTVYMFTMTSHSIRSTNIGRTIATARCVLGGMFNSQNLSRLQEPVKIHVDDSKKDPLLPRTAVCHVLRQINHFAMIHGGDLPGLREDRLLIENILDFEPDGTPGKHKLNFIDVRDDIVARETHGYSVPDALQSHRAMIEENASKVIYYAFCAHEEAEREVALKLSTGPLVHLLLNNIEQADQTGVKMYLYSCHDSSLVGLLGTLDIYDFKWPPFGSDVRFELYEDKDGKQYVRVSYNGKDQTIRGCSSELCPLEEFKQNMEPYSLDPQAYNKLCSSNILEVIAQEMLEKEKGEVEDTEDTERSDTPAGM